MAMAALNTCLRVNLSLSLSIYIYVYIYIYIGGRILCIIEFGYCLRDLIACLFNLE